MNKYDLFEAIGGVDDSLLRRAEQSGKRTSFRKFVIAAAAVMALTVTVWAAPLIAELLFETDRTLAVEGYVSERSDGKLVVYADTYRIDFTLENPEAAADHFETFAIPTYFEKQAWYQDYGYALTVYDLYPSMEYMWLPTENSNSWVTFSQSVFVPADGVPAPPLGVGQFFLPIPPGYELYEETLQILGTEVTAYRVDYEANFGERYLFWTDGQYAYELNTTTDISGETIGEIIASIDHISDNSDYLKIGTHMIPGYLIP